MRLKILGNGPSLLLYLSLILFIYFFVFKSFFGKFRRKNEHFHSDLLHNMDINCQNISVVNSTFKVDMRQIEDRLLYSKNRCATLKSMYNFNEFPYSDEEAEFPLAYGMIVYKELGQVLFMLSSIYQPQNEYCVAVGENSEALFQNMFRELADCFPNVHFMKRPPISWGSHEIINSAYGCLEFLSHLKSDWRYFQYLSGVDAPLKTNLEMVRILKMLNGTVNVEMKEYQEGRLRGKNITNAPLPLFKSSLSALIPRESANALASSLMPRELLEFLENTGIADEGFWGTLFGNKDRFSIPGSLNAKDWINYRKSAGYKNISKSAKYYISRDQIWTSKDCRNFMKSGSCVFGVGDVPRLLKSRALVAHKFYLKSQPEGYLCILKEIRRRSEHPDENFDASVYSKLPQVQLRRGVNLTDLDTSEWMI